MVKVLAGLGIISKIGTSNDDDGSCGGSTTSTKTAIKRSTLQDPEVGYMDKT